MRVTGTVMGLDLGIRTGIAEGCPGEHPCCYCVDLKKPSEHRSVCFSNLIAFLNQRFTTAKPDLVVKEKMLTLEAFRQIGNAEATVRLHAGLHAVVEGLCGRFGIPWTEAADSTVRKHFLGKGRMGTREDTKRAVVKRCQLLGLIPKDCEEDNRADAAAVHDWACANFGRKSVSSGELFLFGKAAEYDGQRDLADSLDVGYAAIRERVAAGGEPWVPGGGDDAA